MIGRNEILEFAGQFKLRPQVIEKDYVLGWLLAGIYHREDLRSSWTFKGGTCLKKCFFETYRFSEDLDFTVTLARISHGLSTAKPSSSALTALRSLGLLEVRTVRLRGPRSRRLVRTALTASRNDNP